MILCSTACTKSEINSGSKGEEKMIKLNVALGSYSTRSIDLPYNSGDAVALNIQEVKVFAYDAESGGSLIFQETVEFKKNGQAGGSTNYGTELAVPVEVKRVKVEFNSDQMNVAGIGVLGSDVNSRQGSSTQTVVRVLGEALVSAANTASITAYAEMARLQIVDNVETPTDTEPTIYKDLTLQAVYINNTKIEREGVKKLTEDDVLNTDFTITGSKKNLFDELKDATDTYNCNVTGADGVYTLTNMENTHFFTRTTASNDYPKEIVNGKLRGETIGYNLFPQGDKSETDILLAQENLPFVIIKIGYTEKLIGNTWTHVDVVNGLPHNDGNADNNFSYLKVIAYDDATATFPAYVGGKVYEFSMDDLLTVITTPTGPQGPVIKINVTIKDWLYEEHDLIPDGGIHS